MKRIAFILLTLSLILASFLLVTSAANFYEPIDTSVQFSVTGNAPSEPCKFRLEAITSGSPLPSTTEVSTVGNQTASFESITYTGVGLHKYKLYQVRGENSKCIYDDVVYIITILAANDKDGALQVSHTIEKEGEAGTKYDVAVFRNQYPDEPKTADEFPGTAWHLILPAASLFVLCIIGLVLEDRKNRGRNERT